MPEGDLHIVTTRVNVDRGRSFYHEREPVPDTIFANTPRDSLRGEIYRHMLGEYGRCTGKVYVDHRVPTNDCGGERWEVLHTGWVFLKREKYDDYHSTETYLCETWITLERVVREPEHIPGKVESVAL